MTHHLFETYRPHAGQQALHNAAARFTAVCAGVRSGKTFGTAREFLRRVYADRFWKPGPLHYWAVAPTYDLTNVQHDALVEVLSPHWRALVRQNLKSERRLELTGGIVIAFKSAHDPKTLVGVGLDGLWMDEAARVDPEAWRGQLRMRLSDRLGWALFSTTPQARNWFYEEIWRRADEADPERFDPQFASVHFATTANTALPHLAAEVDQARRDLPERYFAREYLASFDAFIGQVYEEFDPATHVVDDADLPAAFKEVRVGVDWGYRNPGAMIVVGRDGDDVWWVVEEIVRAKVAVDSSHGNKTWVDYAKELHRKYPSARFLCDPAMPGHLRSFRAVGIPAQAADNRVAAGIQLVATLMHPLPETGPRLRVHRRCTHLLAEIPNYRWQEDDIAAEEPVKQDDHALDALRYALLTKPHQPGYW
ncbi:MAG: hypothetical protein H6683_06435 [Deltaproteobacteria bacterium]|nr:hypothetical protein [Deltaproteobacteria bacterium]